MAFSRVLDISVVGVFMKVPFFALYCWYSVVNGFLLFSRLVWGTAFNGSMVFFSTVFSFSHMMDLSLSVSVQYRIPHCSHYCGEQTAI
jgi:hypothetical protein